MSERSSRHYEGENDLSLSTTPWDKYNWADTMLLGIGFVRGLNENSSHCSDVRLLEGEELRDVGLLLTIDMASLLLAFRFGLKVHVLSYSSSCAQSIYTKSWQYAPTYRSAVTYLQ